jgi:hypothetical protein
MDYYEAKRLLNERYKFRCKLDRIKKTLDLEGVISVQDVPILREKEVLELKQISDRLKGILKRWSDNTELIRKNDL